MTETRLVFTSVLISILREVRFAVRFIDQKAPEKVIHDGAVLENLDVYSSR